MKRYHVVTLTGLLLVCMSSFVYGMGIFSGVPEKPYCETRYPLLLVPGVTGFDKLFGAIDYWYGIPAALEESGAVVIPVAVTGWQSTEERGEELVRTIRDLLLEHPEYKKFNVIGHSHGATTARYAMNQLPEAFASLTTIAGPHQGTPTADFMKEDLPDMMKPLVYGGIELFAGDLVALISGNSGFVGNQDIEACIDHFSMEGIAAFNRDYPCAGVPQGSSLGSYGDDADTVDGEFWGDGRGNPLNPGDSGAIRYYSWTGNIGTGGATTLWDLLDIVMVFTQGMNLGYGYDGDADGFIPVSSSHFGEVVCDNYFWNHLDEINQMLGIRSPFSANPVSVFRMHANRLQNEGL